MPPCARSYVSTVGDPVMPFKPHYTAATACTFTHSAHSLQIKLHYSTSGGIPFESALTVSRKTLVVGAIERGAPTRMVPFGGKGVPINNKNGIWEQKSLRKVGVKCLFGSLLTHY